ncbi:MAG TPA: ATP-binding protein [Rhodanobacteraceae bacterium]
MAKLPLEPFFQKLAGVLTTSLLLVDATRRVTWGNDAVADLLRAGVRGVTGQPLARFFPEAAAELAAVLTRARASGTTVDWRQVNLTALDESQHCVDVAVQAVSDTQWLMEIHALVRAGSGPRPLAASLRGVAHELKNPLTGMRGAAQLLARRTGDDESRQLANIIVDEADRLAALANRWLTHGGGVQLRETGLYPLLEKVRRLCATRGVTITEDYDPSLPDIVGDADRLQQLLLNLALNAVEVGADRLHLRTRIALGAMLPAGQAVTAVRVDIIDNGPGVAEDLREHLFEPMVSGRPGGTGLGLALALETARDHGGDLRYTRASEGSVFSLYLPLPRRRGKSS